MCGKRLDPVFIFLACCHSSTTNSTRVRGSSIRHIHSGDVLHPGIGHILRRDTDRVFEARGAQVGPEEQMG